MFFSFAFKKQPTASSFCVKLRKLGKFGIADLPCEYLIV
jgi:hypothetical protein